MKSISQARIITLAYLADGKAGEPNSASSSSGPAPLFCWATNTSSAPTPAKVKNTADIYGPVNDYAERGYQRPSNSTCIHRKIIAPHH